MINNPSSIKFHIGKVPIYGVSALAPMDGFSDQPFRQLIRGLGSAFMISEFVNAIDIQRGHKYLNNRLAFSDTERPFGFQILDNEIERFVKGAQFLESLNPDFLDLNFGCPSKQVTHRGAGSALLLLPDQINLLSQKVINAINIPVTAKIRLGWDESTRNYLEICKILEGNGCSMISVHARTKIQAYKGVADWNAIREIKEHSKIPILGNGDIKSVLDIKRMLSTTGCDGVLVGRTAIQNPWIFSGKDFWEIKYEEVISFYRSLFSNITTFYGDKIAPKIFRKYLVKMMSNYPDLLHSEKIEILTTNDANIVYNSIDKIVQKNHGQVVKLKGENEQTNE